MMTVDALKSFGANVDEGLRRCMNNEGSYLKMVSKAVQNDSFEKLEGALEGAVKEGDLGAAFDAAHALKGVLANLALSPIHEPICEIVELLRGKTQMDYSPLVQKILEKRNELKAL